MDRYIMVEKEDGHCEEVASEQGGWVKHTDHAAALAAKDAEIEREREASGRMAVTVVKLDKRLKESALDAAEAHDEATTLRARVAELDAEARTATEKHVACYEALAASRKECEGGA